MLKQHVACKATYCLLLRFVASIRCLWIVACRNCWCERVFIMSVQWSVLLGTSRVVREHCTTASLMCSLWVSFIRGQGVSPMSLSVREILRTKKCIKSMNEIPERVQIFVLPRGQKAKRFSGSGGFAPDPMTVLGALPQITVIGSRSCTRHSLPKPINKTPPMVFTFDGSNDCGNYNDKAQGICGQLIDITRNPKVIWKEPRSHPHGRA